MSRGSLVFLVLVGCGGGGHATSDGSPGDCSGCSGGDGAANGDAGIDADLACPVPMPPSLHAQEIVGTGLTQPVYVTQPPGSTDLYVVEKPGRIRIIRGGAVLTTPFLDVTADVNIVAADAEGGLLGVAFKSDYVTSGRFFVYETLKADSTLPDRVAIREYHRSANPDVADPTPVAELISAPHGGYNNVGGAVQFGPDGYLYLAPGDAAITPNSPAQDLTSRLGKMLRLDVDNPGTPPAGNLGGSADPYVWDYGLRNPFRFSFDRQTGDLYIADAGDTLFEEVDIEPPGTGKRDYGWDRMEGPVCHDGSMSCGATGTLPAYSRAHEAGFSVIVGGVVYRGTAMPCLRGRYIFGIFGGAKVLSWVWNGTAITDEVELTDMLGIDATNIVAFGEDQQGEVYPVTLDGHVYKLVPN